MRAAQFIIEETRHVAPESGRGYLLLKPVFEPDCCADGKLSFASWTVWEDAPHTHEQARSEALSNASKVLAQYALANHALLRLVRDLEQAPYSLTPDQWAAEARQVLNDLKPWPGGAS